MTIERRLSLQHQRAAPSDGVMPRVALVPTAATLRAMVSAGTAVLQEEEVGKAAAVATHRTVACVVAMKGVGLHGLATVNNHTVFHLGHPHLPTTRL